MRLADYDKLIRNLPYLDQAFETSKNTWSLKKYSFCSSFVSFHRNTFKANTIKISRADLFYVADTDVNEAIFSTILWGYPRNMRGNSFGTVLKCLNQIQQTLSIKKNITESQFKRLSKELKNTGIGLSTLSKLLYFFRFSIEDNRCLILDSRIIEVLRSDMYHELHDLNHITEFNKINNYLCYLKAMKKLSKQIDCLEDQLELFLFLFGKNLKSSSE